MMRKADWPYVLDSWRRRFWLAAVLAGAIVIDSLLFVLWFFVDHGVTWLIEWLHAEKDLNAKIAIAFRFVASGTALVLASLHAISDIIEVFGEVRDNWNAVMNPEHRHVDDVQGAADESA